MSPDSVSTVRRSPFAVAQRWSAYAPSDHAVWTTLYRRRLATLPDQASRRFLAGMAAVGFEPDRIPDLKAVNTRLAPLTGWRAVPVSGFLEARRFFESLGRRRFPTTVTIRSAESIDYTPEPDIFHDVFGHVPLHADPVFARWLRRFGALGAIQTDPDAIERITRVFWFTVEFGLVREGGSVKIYGSGLISSAAEAVHALGSACEQRPFDLDLVMETPFEIDRLQSILYVIDDFEQLSRAIDQLGARFGGPARRG